LGLNLKRLRTKIIRDYFNHTLSPYFESQRIIHNSLSVNTAQQNRVAARKNEHLINNTQTLLFQENTPKSY
jgi:hypothetical protein